MTPRCGTCKHYNAPVDKNGRRTNRQHSRCVWTSPAPVVPVSVRQNGYGSFRWPPDRHFMPPTSGSDCPCWEPYK